MKRNRLAYELTNFCLAYGILNATHEAEEMRQGIEARFDDVAFVEELIHLIGVRSNNRKDIDKNKIKELLLELERLRLEHEYGESERTKAR